MRKGEVALEKYVITKTLTKPPEAYPDAKNQPHVQVKEGTHLQILYLIFLLFIIFVPQINILGHKPFSR